MYYYYNIYGLIIRCNVCMPLLKREAACIYNIDLTVIYENLPPNSLIKISENDEFYRVDLCSFASYKIHKNKQLIDCRAQNFTDFFSTFFNIPFSVYLMISGEVLFHTNTVLNNNKLICFCGKKGVGKSTLTNLINNEEDFMLYSDDTIRVDKDYSCMRAYNLIKLTEETLDAYKFDTRTGVKNSAGKEYCIIKAEEHKCKFKYIFQLSRCSEFGISSVNNPALKRSIIVGNIVGVEYFCRSLLEKTIDISKRIYADFYNLYIPNTLKALQNSRDDIRNAIANLINK